MIKISGKAWCALGGFALGFIIGREIMLGEIGSLICGIIGAAVCYMLGKNPFG